MNYKTFNYYLFGLPRPFPDWRPLPPTGKEEAK